jgi:hypothetical protein
VRYRAGFSRVVGKLVGLFRKQIVILGNRQKIVPILEVIDLLCERAPLFCAFAKIGGIVQMGMISHSHGLKGGNCVFRALMGGWLEMQDHYFVGHNKEDL